jgi:hypothetical protein
VVINSGMGGLGGLVDNYHAKHPGGHHLKSDDLPCMHQTNERFALLFSPSSLVQSVQVGPSSSVRPVQSTN